MFKKLSLILAILTVIIASSNSAFSMPGFDGNGYQINSIKDIKTFKDIPLGFPKPPTAKLRDSASFYLAVYDTSLFMKAIPEYNEFDSVSKLNMSIFYMGSWFDYLRYDYEYTQTKKIKLMKIVSLATGEDVVQAEVHSIYNSQDLLDSVLTRVIDNEGIIVNNSLKIIGYNENNISDSAFVYLWNVDKWDLAGVETYSYDSEDRVIEIYYYKYSNGNYILYQKDTYKYQDTGKELLVEGYENNTFYPLQQWSYNLNENGTVKSGVRMDFAGESWRKVIAIENDFDSKNRISFVKTYLYNFTEWENYSNRKYEYDNNNDVVKETYYSIVDSESKLYRRNSYQYIAKGKPTVNLFEMYMNNEWVPRVKHEFVYDIDMNLIQRTISIYNNDQWLLQIKSEYYNGPDGKLEKTISYYNMNESGEPEWVLSSIDSLVLNAKRQPIWEYVIYNFDFENKTADTTKYEYYYDSQGNVVEMYEWLLATKDNGEKYWFAANKTTGLYNTVDKILEHKGYVTRGGNWEETLKITYNYDIDDNLLNELTYFFAESWSEDTKIEYTLQNETGIDQENNNSFDMTAYPNPASIFSLVRFNLDNPGHTTIRLVDSKGFVVATLMDKYMNSGEATINFSTAGYPSGIYNLQILNGGKSQTTKLVIVK